MSAISDEGKMINLIEEELTPFLKEFGYFKKIRESDPSIWAETVIFEKDKFELEVTACLHPHDYPFSLSVSFIDRNIKDPLYIFFNKLLQPEDIQLPISTDFQTMENTIKKLKEGLSIIFSNNLHLKANK